MKMSEIEKNDDLTSISMEMLELDNEDISKIAGGRGSSSCNYYVFPPEYIVGNPPKRSRLGGGLNFSFIVG